MECYIHYDYADIIFWELTCEDVHCSKYPCVYGNCDTETNFYMCTAFESYYSGNCNSDPEFWTKDKCPTCCDLRTCRGMIFPLKMCFNELKVSC